MWLDSTGSVCVCGLHDGGLFYSISTKINTATKDADACAQVKIGSLTQPVIILSYTQNDQPAVQRII